MKYLRWIWNNTGGIRLNMAARVLAGLLQVVLGLGMVWLCKTFIDETIRTGSNRDIVLVAFLMVGAALTGIVLRQLYYYLGVRAQTLQSNGLRLRIFGRLMHRRLYEGQPLHSGELVSRLEKDIDQVSDTVASMIPEVLVTGCKLLGAFLMLHWMDATLAWVLLVLTPLFLVVGKLIARRLRRMTHDIRSRESRIQMTMQEGLEHNEVIRSMESTDWLTGQVDGMQAGLLASVGRRTRYTAVTRSMLAACFSLGYLLAFVWGGLQLRSGAITIGVMTSFLQLVGQIQQPILGLLNLLPQLMHTSAGIDRLAELESLETEDFTSEEVAAGQSYGHVMGIDMDDVSYSYADGDRKVLDHFTHHFEPGSRTAIVGPTGVGKTTLFRLLLGFAEPASGGITVFDASGSVPAGPATRRHMVFVPQGNTLMSGTIRYNLQLARPDATDTELLQALHTAMADFVSDLPEGLDTVLGERAAGLSEGQAQRIAIARGLLRPGSILLLDEISSALDSGTERELFSRLFAACPDKTILLITHRSEVAALCGDTITLSELHN